MIHRLGIPRAPVGLEYVQPLPWQAGEVYVSFTGGPAYTCQVTRHPGDLIRVGLDGLDLPDGTPAEIQWTQDNRGSYACGTVVAAPAGEPAGLYVRIDESVSGVERRVDARADVSLPVLLSDRSGRTAKGRTVDLSQGGAHVAADPSDAAFLPGDRITAELTLPGGAVRSRCLVSATGADPGDVRLRFLDPDGATVTQLGAYLRTVLSDT